ncbi:MAG: hypothetical protein H8K03_22875 (plasmid) [Nitrospira sp.]
MEGGGGGIAGKGNPGPLFPSTTPRAKPKSLLEAISDIEKLSAVERTGMEIPPHFLLLNEKFGYFDVGLKGAWADMLVNIIFTPISVGVIDRVIPIFGTHDPTVTDQVFSLLIGLSYTLGINILLAFNLGACYFGKVCRNAIWQLYGGFVTGSILKMLLIFVVFHFLYWRITPDIISNVLTSTYFVVHGIFTVEQWDHLFYFLVDFRNLLFKSGIFIVISTMVCLTLPGISFLLGSRRAHREDEMRRQYDAI